MTDEVLSRAFQQYVHATGHKKRAVSSAPGPLYHRQRLGRRRMTELNSLQSSASIPVWALPNAPDMTKWQWQPPRPPPFWPQPPQVEDEVETDSGPIPPEPEVAVQPLVEPETPKSLAPCETATVGKQSMLRPPDEMILRLQLQALHNDTFPTSSDFARRCRTFAKLFRKEISYYRLPGPEIFEIYNSGRRAIIRAGRGMPEATRSSLFFLLSNVIHGMKAAGQLHPGSLRTDSHHWTMLLNHVALLDANVKSARLLVLLMESMPPMHRFKTRGAVLNVLGTFFRLWQGLSTHGIPADGLEPEAVRAVHLAVVWAGRADKILYSVGLVLKSKHLEHARAYLEAAEKCHERASRFAFKAAHLLSDDRQLITDLADALKTHDPLVHRSLFVIATRLTDSQGRWTRLRYNWLQILARLPNVRRSKFKRLLGLFQKRGCGALTHTELGYLLLLHWESTGMLKNRHGIHKMWKKLRGEDDAKSMAALAFAINAIHPPEQCTAIFWSFWDFMRLRVGARTVIKQMLSLSKCQKLSNGFLKRLAWTSRDHRIALMLLDLSVNQTGKSTNAWGPTFWEKYVTQNKNKAGNTLVNPAVLLEKLLRSWGGPLEAVCQETGGEPQVFGKDSDLKRRQIMRIRECIKGVARSPALTERQRFRHTSAFTKYLADVQGFLTARDLASLTEVITAALRRGHGGSTQRLRWYLGIVLERLGEEVCVKVGLLLRRRREWNGRQLDGSAKPAVPVVKPKTASDLHRQHYRGPHRGRTWPLWRYFLPQNRRVNKLRRVRTRSNQRIRSVRIPDQQPHETPDCHLHVEAKAEATLDGDAFGALSEGSYRREIDPRASV